MDIPTQLRLALQSSNHPTPSTPWLTSLCSRNPPPPLQSLLATAKARLLAADLTLPSLLDPSHTSAFPPDITAPETPERTLPSDMHVQVVDIENLTRSRWDQVEELEALERGEGTKGREIIRLPTSNADDDGEDGVDAEGGGTSRVSSSRTASNAGAGAGRDSARKNNTSSSSAPATAASASATASAGKNATHRLVLQDCKGKNVYAMELRRVPRIGVGVTGIGQKMMLRSGTVVARGTVLLEPEKCVVLGGRIEAWQRPWVEGRLKRLREAVGADRPAGP